jgi:hypothetical protein
MWAQRGIPVDAIVPSGEKPTRASAICPRRLRKAATLTADKMGPGQYAVRGSTEKVYYVDVNADVPCMCKDSEFNAGLQCKHLLYCRMREGDESVLLALGQMLVRDEKHRKEFMRQRRRALRAG